MNTIDQLRTPVSNDLVRVIHECSGNHKSIADIAAQVLKHQFVCVSANGKLWYHFNGTHWEIDSASLLLNTELSSTVTDVFNNAIAKTDNKAVVKRLQAIAFKLGNIRFKSEIIKAMRESMYDEDFLAKLASNPNLGRDMITV